MSELVFKAAQLASKTMVMFNVYGSSRQHNYASGAYLMIQAWDKYALAVSCAIRQNIVWHAY